MASHVAGWTMRAPYTYGRYIKAGNLAEAVATVTRTFTEKGWGLPPGTTNLDFGAVFAAKKVDANFRPTHVLGFCMPKHAHEILMHEPAAAVLLPCNIVVAEKEQGVFEVSTIAPAEMGKMMMHHEEVKNVINEVDERIKLSLQALPGSEDQALQGW